MRRKKAMPEIYVSTDIEADGPIPGPNSMLSFASAAYTADKTLLSTFSANLLTLPGAVADPKTMEWWKTQPDAWAQCRRDPQQPQTAMPAYVSWLKALPGTPVFVAYPAAYDFMFVYWYLIRFAGESPFSFSALDVWPCSAPTTGVRPKTTCRKRGSTRCRTRTRHWMMPSGRARCSATCSRPESASWQPPWSNRARRAE